MKSNKNKRSKVQQERKELGIESRILFKPRNGKKQHQYTSKSRSSSLLNPEDSKISSYRSINNQSPDLVSMRSPVKPSIDDNIDKKLEELQKRADEIIYQKLMNELSKDRRIITLKSKKNNSFDHEIDDMIKQVTKIDTQGSNIRYQLQQRKLNLIEKLIAQSCIESESLRKDFFAINTIIQRKKFTRKTQLSKASDIKLQLSNIPRNNSCSKSLSIQSTSRQSFRAPQPEDYEKYRYQRKKYVSNNQPFPRSSYKSEYLIHHAEVPKLQTKKIDTYAFFNRSRQKGSTYKSNFKPLKTEIQNYKQLDSYRDKITKLNVSYVIKKTQGKETQQESKRMNTINLSPINKPSSKISTIKQSGRSLNRGLALITESRRQYKEASQEIEQIRGKIKHKELNRLKYLYKKIGRV